MRETADDTSDKPTDETTGAQHAVRHVLVLPDRDSAERVVEQVSDNEHLDREPELVREALAGDDDAEDAQWLVVVDDSHGVLDPAALEKLVTRYEGWLEREHSDQF